MRGDLQSLCVECDRKFQSTPLHEGRPGISASAGLSLIVSIHAPAWGATFFLFTHQHKTSFNPRPCMRGDMRKKTFPSRIWFQSTPLHEGRQVSANIATSLCMFQSTPLHEGRPMSLWLKNLGLCFNPRPCMRGDVVLVSVSFFDLFQSTPLHEGRLLIIKQIHHLSVFQSTPLHEGRPFK